MYKLLYESQFHGSNRLAERKNRCWWIIALALFFGAAASIITVTIVRYINNPAFLAIMHSKDIRMKFPTVGICPEIYYPEHKVEEFIAGLYYPPGVNSSNLKAVIQQLAAFYSPDVKYSIFDLKLIESILDYNVLTVLSATKKLTASCEEILLRCRLYGVTMNCSSLFTMELTNYGFCCIFNGRSLRRELLNQHTHETEDLSNLFSVDTGPFSIATLTSVVYNNQRKGDLDITYKWVYLESGQQFMETVGNGTPISPNTEVSLGYHTKRFVIPGDESVGPELRNCRQSTTKLKYFPSYSRRYCMLECEMERTLQRCQCMKVNNPLPHNVARCRARDLLCAKNSAATSTTCDCPVTCDSVIDLYVVQSYPLKSGNYIIDELYQGLDFSKVTVVRAYLLHHEKEVRKRQSYYTAEHLFAQIGGVFNVFFGCSVLTLIEVIQLVWHSYLEYKAVKALNKKPELILPPVAKDEKETKNNKENFKDKLDKLHSAAWE